MYYFVNSKRPTEGPGIFGSRLHDELKRLGHTPVTTVDSWEMMEQFMNLCIISGNYIQHAFNVLRLNGLYLDSNDFQTDQKNNPIFHCYNDFDHIVFQSQFSRKCYEHYLGQKTNTVIYNGAPSEFKPMEKDMDALESMYPPLAEIAKKYSKVCITAAKWRRHKRLEEMADAFRSPKLKNVCLIALGVTDNYSLGRGYDSIPDNVYFVPTFATHALPAIYSMADAFIYLSWLDWCPNSVVEALCCGLPVLCSHNGGTNELVRGSGLIIKLEDHYKIGTRVPLYDPPPVDREVIVQGILEIVEQGKHPGRTDLSIEVAAKQYETVGEAREGAVTQAES
jgi:glycosyltransferase involved in cell wall biosynthesis